MTEPGATIRRAGPNLQVWAGGERRATLLVNDLGQLVLAGNIMLTPAVLDFLFKRRVDTVFLTLHGAYRGRLECGSSRNITLRSRQHERLRDPATALTLSRAIVRGKIANSRTLLLKAARRRGVADDIRVAAARMAAMAERLDEMETLEQVRGCEGRAAAVYFGSLPHLIRGSELRFEGRTRRPPLDPVNVLLSLGYTLLANAVESAVQVVGLDPHLGGLHAPLDGRPSLVCDLMEEHRSTIVDPLVLSVLNRRSFKPSDFESEGEGTPVRFERGAMQWFIELFERRMRGRIQHPGRGQRLTWIQVIEEQVRQFARVLVAADEEYRPFVVR